jgi:hypothetical protein
MDIAILSIALLIVAGLAFYAGSLLFQLKVQQNNRKRKTQQRISTISESIQTIAMAVEQEQCNLSEGTIRVYHLLEGLPIKDKSDFSIKFPNLYAMYTQIRDLPTHQARKEQPKDETRNQDLKRQVLEEQFKADIIQEMSILKTFSI